jgi:hypothetical protein
MNIGSDDMISLLVIRILGWLTYARGGLEWNETVYSKDKASCDIIPNMPEMYFCSLSVIHNVTSFYRIAYHWVPVCLGQEK